ncbi:hypothetical protein FNQ90_00790 [Streptomyces alkaliphilus]|uniref:Uncharacterized protein n=1 Tax=Streptomyces alkaliphilus TaxID=1472722 RepID=A0A7W3XZL6_9ACTN|nr:hypothetical protein [Streptomyces alkaliphilus]MBB0242679.1 hypothetical protein [Streptomyces alkaliphilus]
MTSASLRRSAIALVGAGALALGPALSASAENGEEGLDEQTQQEIEDLREAMEPYQDVDQAIEDGYVQAEECVETDDGAIGYHYYNPDYINQDVNQDEPPVLVYLPDPDGEPGDLRLGAVEYIVADEGQDPPELFGQEFESPPEERDTGEQLDEQDTNGEDNGEDNGAGLIEDQFNGDDAPDAYSLYVWLFWDNPDGIFNPYNTDATCEVEYN